MNNLKKMNLRLHSLVLFHSLLDDEVLIKLSELLSCGGKSPVEQVSCYSAFASLLFEQNGNLSKYLVDRMLEQESSYVLKRAQKQPVNAGLEECLKNELAVLEALSQLTSGQVKQSIHYNGFLPDWNNTPLDLTALYMERMSQLSSFGYGIFSKYRMFHYSDGIHPVKYPDSLRLSSLIGYRTERDAVINNTLALLEGKPAANVLLYGDAGTGKSSTVKAIVNEFYTRGLRLIEIKRNQFNNIPVLLEQLSNNPLKFILFIDDLSFTKDNDDYNALKAILEGSVCAKMPNIIIYATSNRRHLIKESFSDREGDDIHFYETLQEMASLSERFGLTVGFFKPDKELYLNIVHGLKEQYGLKISQAELDSQAEKYAIERGGRSPRVARQFIESVKSMEE